MTATALTLTEAHLDKLPDEDLRTIALRIVNDAISAFDTSIGEYDHPDLDPAAVHEAANSLRKILTNPDNGYDSGTSVRHQYAVRDFCNAAYDIGEASTRNGREFPPRLNASAVDWMLLSVYYDGTPHRPTVWRLPSALVDCGYGFIPGHETTVGYVLKALCVSDDPRLPALAETYVQSGLHATLRDAIDEATQQLARLDDLAELTR